MDKDLFKLTKQNSTDEWFTPDSAVYPLLPYISSDKTIWCPFDFDDSAYVRVLSEHGCNVINGHIENGDDFFDYTPDNFDVAVSNPPYSKRTEILSRLFSIGKPFAMIMNFTGIFDNRDRFNMFSNNGIELLILRGRTSFIRRSDGKQGSPVFQSVYVCHGLLPEKIVYQI